MTPRPPFRLFRLDHVHIRVPDRAEAARWYAEHLGFEPVAEYAFWAEGFEGGPLQIWADGGHTTLALFEASDGHPMVRQEIADPWGNRYECNTYEYDRIRTELVEADGIAPQRFWPSQLLAEYRDRRE